MSPPDFSPALGDAAIEQAAQDLARDGYVRLEGVLASATAQLLYDYLKDTPDWGRTFNEGSNTWNIDPDKMAAFESSVASQQVHRGMMEAAREGFQYVYDAVRVADESEERTARGWLVDQLLEALNSPAWLEVFRRVTGEAAVNLVDGQATRYLPGHFLTGHDDGIAGKNRVAAYVLGLTPRWRTEWGGLLQFHEQDGDVTRGLAPKFNVINLFSVPRQHSVSPVSEFAGAPRLSVTGWVRHAG